jgi:hypothetical protein
MLVTSIPFPGGGGDVCVMLSQAWFRLLIGWQSGVIVAYIMGDCGLHYGRLWEMYTGYGQSCEP